MGLLQSFWKWLEGPKYTWKRGAVSYALPKAEFKSFVVSHLCMNKQLSVAQAILDAENWYTTKLNLQRRLDSL